jgi:transposase
MQIRYLLPDQRLLCIESLEVDETSRQIRLTVHSRSHHACCPCCGKRSRRVHSRYSRAVADLPWAEFAVLMRLRVRRFRCLNRDCPQAIFTERLPTIAPAWARRTKRLSDVQGSIGLSVGSSAGVRICRLTRIPLSIDSLLRTMRRHELPMAPTPQVLGVDDWAKRRGHSYGTLLVDMETHCPVDLLPDREAKTLANWLQQHPGVQIISRDRAGAYAEGARQGAPGAIQIADRWHLLKNLNDALIRCLDRHRRRLRSLSPVTSSAADVSGVIAADAKLDLAATLSPARAELRQCRREARLARYTEVRDAHARGLTISAIARLTGLDRKTVRKYSQATEFPEQAPRSRARRGSILDPFKAHLLQRWHEGCRTGRVLWRELRQVGFPGGFTLVNDFLRQLRRTQAIPSRTRMLFGTHDPAQATRPVTSRSLACLIVARLDKLTDDHHRLLEQASQLHPDIQTIVQFGQAFAALVRNRQPDGLDAWLDRVLRCDIPSLRGFARGLRRDYQAVKAALTFQWNNGMAEGHVNRLKFLKRQGYGRADFDLLRLRVLFNGQFD